MERNQPPSRRCVQEKNKMLKPLPAYGCLFLRPLLSPPPAGAIGNCKATTTCTSAMQACAAHRTKKKLSPILELNCEQAKTVCDFTGIWRSKYVRNNPPVTECKVVKQ